MLFLNNPLLTSDGITASFEQLVLNEKTIAAPSYTVHSMSILPENLKKYKNSYIWIDPKLYYVKVDGQQENIDLIIPESVSDYLQTTFINLKNKAKTAKLTQFMVDEILELNPNHSPQVLVQPPSALEQFQTKLKTLFFDNANPVESLEIAPRFQSRFHRLKQILMTVLSLTPQSNLQEKLRQLKQSTLIDWDNTDSHTQFELLDQSYGYFMPMSEDKKKILKEIFSKLSMACQTMITLFEKTNDVDGTLAYHYAYSLMALLLNPDEIKDAQQTFDDISRATHKLFESYQSKSSQPLHDLLLVQLQLPRSQKIADRIGWLQFIKLVGAASIDYLVWAQKIEQKIAEQPKETGLRAPKNLKEAKKIAKHLTYTRADEDPHFAELCHRYKVDEYRFESCLKYMGPMSSEWPKKNGDMLPDIEIEGKNDAAGFYWVKLPVTDKRALILGDITMCCQSIGGHSEACVKDGVSLANNGFYVLLRQENAAKVKTNFFINGEINDKDFDIVGQGYLWKSAAGNLCFDSIECLSSVPVPVIQQMLSSFALRALEDKTIKRVNIGTGGKTPAQLFDKSLIAEKVMPGTTDYYDADKQYCIAKNTSEIHKSLLTDSAEFNACVEYLLDYVDNPSEFLKQLKKVPNITKNLTNDSLMRLLLLTKHPTIDDLMPINLDELEKLPPAQRVEQLKNTSLAKLLWNVGNLSQTEQNISWKAYEKSMQIAGSKIAKILTLVPEDMLERVEQVLQLFDSNNKSMEYFLKADKRVIYERFKSILPQQIKNYDNLSRIERKLLPASTEEICLTIADKLPKMLIEAGTPVNRLSPKLLQYIVEIIPLPSKHDINSVKDFNAALYYYKSEEQRENIYALMQDKLPELINCEVDMSLACQSLNSDQKIAFSQAVYHRLRSQSEYNPKLLDFVSYFTPVQATEICDNLIDTLSPSVIKSAFAVLMKYLSSEKQDKLLQTKIDLLPDCIHTVGELSTILFLLPNDRQRALFFEKMKNKFSVLSIPTCYSFESIMRHLTPEQQEIFYDKVQYKLPKLVSSLVGDKEEKIKEIKLLFSYTVPIVCTKISRIISQSLHENLENPYSVSKFLYMFPINKKHQLFETLRKIFIPHIITAEDYNAVTENLLPTQCGELYDELKQKIPGLKRPVMTLQELSSENLWKFFYRFSPEELKALYMQSKEEFLALVKSEDDADMILKRLPWDEKIDFLKLILTQMPHIIKSVRLISTFTSYYGKDQDKEQHILAAQEPLFMIYAVIEHELPDILKDIYSINTILNAYPSHALNILNRIRDKILVLAKDAQSASDLISGAPYYISEETQAEIYRIIQDKLPNTIHNMCEVNKILQCLTFTQRQDFCIKIDLKIREYIREINENPKKGRLQVNSLGLEEIRELLPDVYQQEINDALAIHHLIKQLDSLSKLQEGKLLAKALVHNHNVKNTFDKLIANTLKNRYLTWFSPKIKQEQLVNEICALEVHWLKKINSALALGLTETQLSSLDDVKEAFNSYVNRTQGATLLWKF